MYNVAIALCCILLGLAYVYWRLLKTNMDIPPGAEKALGPLGRLKFCLDNNIPIRLDM